MRGIRYSDILISKMFILHDTCNNDKIIKKERTTMKKLLAILLTCCTLFELCSISAVAEEVSTPESTRCT